MPVGATFANIFMRFYESTWLSGCPAEYKPIFYRRYIDDTFLLFRHKDHSALFFDYLNNKHSNIYFAMECESCDKLPFLVCLVHRNSDKFEWSVFKKDSFTGLGMSYISNCSFKIKLTCIQTLLSYAYRVCSNYMALHNEFCFLRD